jgi:MoxR-like ATPase
MGLINWIKNLGRKKKTVIPAEEQSHTQLVVSPNSNPPAEPLPGEPASDKEFRSPAHDDQQQIQIIAESTTKSDKMNEEENILNFEETMPPEFKYLEQLILYRMDAFYPSAGVTARVPNFPALETWYFPMAGFIRENKLTREEMIVLLVALAPHVMPELLNAAIEKKLPENRKSPIDFSMIGGARGNNSRFFLPTAQTALFLISGEMLEKRLEVQQFFSAEHIFWEKKILWLEDMQNGEPAIHGRLILSPDYIDLFTYGTNKSPQFSISFPAKKIAPVKEEMAPTLDDLIVPEELKEQIDELKSWVKYNDDLMNRFGMKDKLKKGYRTIFYGPPGTGKTFTAQILGNELKRDVFRIDLSMIVSKYIGETERNLELLFARAENKEWILFFDEADALFGKRTNVKDAHDKYANQEVSYLLQRIEDYNGLIILATNMKNNIDEAFLRRFNLIIKFPFPDQNQRALIWKNALPKGAIFRKKVLTGNPPEIKEEKADIPELVKKYELTGGNIMNIVQYASIKAVQAFQQNENTLQQRKPDLSVATAKPCTSSTEIPVAEEDPKLTIYLSDVLEGIKRELLKEGKPF